MPSKLFTMVNFHGWVYEPSAVKLIALVVTIISTGIVAVASAVWRRLWNWFPIIGRKLFPDLTGTWVGELVSTWKNPATGQGIAPIPVTIWIRQGLFSTSIKLRSGESTSYSTRCLLEADREAGRFRFWYSYDNDPRNRRDLGWRFRFLWGPASRGREHGTDT